MNVMNIKELLHKVNKDLPKEKRVDEVKIEEAKIDNRLWLLNHVNFSQYTNYSGMYIYGAYDIGYREEISAEEIKKNREAFYTVVSETLNLKSDFNVKLMTIQNDSYEEYDGRMHYDFEFYYLVTWFIVK